MLIKKFESFSSDNIEDFISELELDFTGITIQHRKSNPDKDKHLSIVQISIDQIKESIKGKNFERNPTDDQLGWTRRYILKYIENKIRLMSTDGVIIRGLFLTNNRKNILHEIRSWTKYGCCGPGSYDIFDISSYKFINSIKNRYSEISEIRIEMIYSK
jgi:hypothetical protein